MAYVAGDFRFRVSGTFDNGESWVNTWAFRNIADGTLREATVSDLHAFYAAAFLASVSSHTHAVACTSKNLFTGSTIEEDWESISGDDLADLLPTQCAVRISLNSQSGVNGGPFLAGFSVNAVDENGDLVVGERTVLTSALGGLAESELSGGRQLGIERATVPEVVVASRGRVGTRFDVIRKRANDRAESYSTVDLT